MTTRHTRALAHAFALLLAAVTAHAAPPSIEDFQRPPSFSEPVLSPDGRHIAAIVNPDGSFPRWNPCQDVVVLVNFAGAQPHAPQAVGVAAAKPAAAPAAKTSKPAKSGK